MYVGSYRFVPRGPPDCADARGRDATGASFQKRPL